ncbi:hypothetical protein Leryth_004949 [Lithospermum erythrorhizon]|nr:hypothetical protein Leryth_004949 [Lithospermum erythrorhizon]
MGLLSVSRWAFEQGLFCSPNNWNCMEKLLEVLIAIGDEMSCLSVAELILRHWPSHSRALHVKNTIQESEPMPFAPRGVDKLEPKHVRLNFPEKRKVRDTDLDEYVESKKLKHNYEIDIEEASWVALARKLIEVLSSSTNSGSDVSRKYMSGNIKLNLQLPNFAEDSIGSVEKIKSNVTSSVEHVQGGDKTPERTCILKEKGVAATEDQPQERRSSRLESLRNRKPGREDSSFSTSKDPSKVVMRFLESFVITKTEDEACKDDTRCTSPHAGNVKKQESESNEVVSFIKNYCENRGAYHLGHFLLEEVANKGISYHAGTEKLLELEKLTRHCGQERTPECSLFLAELCYDFAVHYSGTAAMSSFTSDAAYHLCKIVESVALEYPLQRMGFALNGKDSGRDTSQEDSDIPSERDSPLSSNYPFWVRYYWLSGQLSLLNGDKVKATEELYVSLSLMTKLQNVKSSSAVLLPHCKTTKKLSVDRVLHEINILEVDILLKKTVPEMIEKGMYSDCIDILAPLLFAAKDIYLEGFRMVNKEGNEFSSVELSALDVLTRACEHMERMDTEVYLSCHRRKLQILMTLFSKVFNASDTDTEIEDNRRHWYQLMAVEVKAISQCASRIMGIIRACGDPSLITIPMAVVGEIQSLLVRLMCNLVKENFLKMSCELGMTDQSEQSLKCYFIDATIALFKLQQLNTSTSIQSQMELIVTIHNMLAEFGICCGRGDGEEEEGTFLKLGIKHLLALDMKLKSVFHSSDKDLGTKQHDLQSLPDNHLSESKTEGDSDHQFNGEVAQTVGDKVRASGDDDPERLSANDISIITSPSAERIEHDCNKDDIDEYDNATQREKEHIEVPQCEAELTEDEREELELGIDTALDQCFYCLYGLNLHSDSSYEDDLAIHKNTSRGDYQTKEQCADVFQYILPYAKASSKTGLVKLRRVLRAIRKHFPHPPDELLFGNAIDKFLDDPELCEDKLSEEAGSVGFLDSIMKVIFSDPESVRQQKCPTVDGSDPYLDVYRNLYYLLALSEEIKSTDKWAGFVLTKEGEEFIAQNANLFKYDLLYNPLRLESWKRLANLYDEEVDLMLNDGSKQINVLAWRKDGMLPKRVEASRRRSRRCLLMALALAKTAVEQGEIHELLALVYYDGAQNVVPFYDQRSTVPVRDDAWMMFCQNSFKHFEKAFAYKEDWSCAFYMGKLCEKLGYSYEKSFSYYSEAISLNPSAVDPFYRMHASRLKLLCTCGKQDEEAIKVVAAYSHSQSTRERLMQLLGPVSEALLMGGHVEDNNTNSECNENLDSTTMGEIWNTLYKDCLLALETCVEGELKHFHKARYVLAQGLYIRGGTGDLEKAKEQLSFCFKSSRSSFTINMWEIDSTVKKARRCGSKKVLEVNLPESSRKFITCIRKYVLLYLNLLEEMGDICTLDRAYISLRTDKRFSLCLEDLVPVTLGRYVRALMSSIRQKEAGSDAVNSTIEQLLEKMFSLFLEQFNMWSDISSIPEIKCQEVTESSLYGHLYKHTQLLEQNLKVEALEVTNEKIRKRLKNPKLSSSNCSTVYKHVSLAWCRSLVISMALITPLHSRISSDLQVQDLLSSGLENSQCLCVDLQSDELWNSSSFEDPTHLKNLEAKFNFALSKLKNVVIKRVSDEDIETATMLLRSSYNFYKDTSCALLPSGINLYMVPSQLATETYIQPGIDGVDILDMNTSRKLLLWAYTLLHGHCSHVSVAIKYCEENAKSKTKKASGVTSVTPNTNPSNTVGPNSETVGTKDGSNEIGVIEASPQTVAPASSFSEAEGSFARKSPIPAEAKDLQNLSNPLPENECGSGSLERRDPRNEAGLGLPNVTSHEKHKMSSLSDSLPQHESKFYHEKRPREEIDLNK